MWYVKPNKHFRYWVRIFIRWHVIIEVLQRLYIKPLQRIWSLNKSFCEVTYAWSLSRTLLCPSVSCNVLPYASWVWLDFQFNPSLFLFVLIFCISAWIFLVFYFFNINLKHGRRNTTGRTPWLMIIQTLKFSPRHV